MSVWVPSVERRRLGENGFEVRLGYELADDYLRFVAARCRPNTVLATAFDLKVFFTGVAKDPVAVTVTDVLEFISEQRRPRRGGNVVRLDDGEAGLSARTIRGGCRACRVSTATCRLAGWCRPARCRRGRCHAARRTVGGAGGRR